MSTILESDVISQTRSKQGLSLRDFAEQIGVSHNAVAQWENGKALVDLNRVTDWLKDDREWVRNMAMAIMGCKVGPAFNLMLAKYKPIDASSGA